MNNKKGRSWFFKETFLLTNISINIALGMSFLILSNVEIEFVDCHINWKTYTVVEILLMIRWLELIQKKEFVARTFDPKHKGFIVDIASMSQDMHIHPFWRTQIALLKADKTVISILPKYAEFLNIFSKDLVAKLPKYIKINNYTIYLIKGY